MYKESEIEDWKLRQLKVMSTVSLEGTYLRMTGEASHRKQMMKPLISILADLQSVFTSKISFILFM